MNSFATQAGNPVLSPASYPEQPIPASPIDMALSRIAEALTRVKDAQAYVEARTALVTVPYGIPPKNDVKSAEQRQPCKLEEILSMVTTNLHDIADRSEALGKAIQL